MRSSPNCLTRSTPYSRRDSKAACLIRSSECWEAVHNISSRSFAVSSCTNASNAPYPSNFCWDASGRTTYLHSHPAPKHAHVNVAKIHKTPEHCLAHLEKKVVRRYSWVRFDTDCLVCMWSILFALLTVDSTLVYTNRSRVHILHNVSCNTHLLIESF